MTLKRTPRPRDPIQLGKLMVDIATGQVPDAVDDGKDAAAVARGRAGGIKGGASQIADLSPEERRALGATAAAARWSAKKRPPP
jgi:hypothetical protein